ncbi:GyrI-like domain-containing protein [Christiangramia sabulilitoris]|uniref:GyrI-like domain-containing protein n=1 Tax=Christiangramia sabulilitoris TaxID=2583991 RepID=A0A550I5Y8_9FLAO|nr:GyrI-like domain-containing protein [Christiangramia sabulilitoris]TRO66390.1 GyrI-like domain-containing protein [Christiangramia sabulilitoris]
MMKEPDIIEMKAKKLVGVSLHTSLADDKTAVLWKRFMDKKDSIDNTKSQDLFSVQVYDDGFISGHFNSQSVFEKWAAVEVEDYSTIDEGLKGLKLPAGLYAVFTHEGTSRQFSDTAKFIFEDWIPSSKYSLDDRPHFEVLGKDYKGPDNPESKEKIWIPIKED